MPRLAEGPEITGVINADAAELTGLKAGTPVVGGGGDQAAGAVGVGAVEPHIISLVIGTSGVVFAPLKKYAFEPEGRLHAFCHAVPGMWHFMGVTLSAAGSLQWYHDTLAMGESFDDLLAPAAEIAPGSDGLVYLPYLSGERTPYPDPLARGAFIGLTTRHSKAHLTRAVLEGVAFSLKDCFGLMANAGLPAQLGGARQRRRRAKSDLAADYRRRDRLAVSDDQQHRRRGLWRGAAGFGRRGRLPGCRHRLQDRHPNRRRHRAAQSRRIRSGVSQLSGALSGAETHFRADVSNSLVLAGMVESNRVVFQIETDFSSQHAVFLPLPLVGRGIGARG